MNKVPYSNHSTHICSRWENHMTAFATSLVLLRAAHVCPCLTYPGLIPIIKPDVHSDIIVEPEVHFFKMPLLQPLTWTDPEPTAPSCDMDDGDQDCIPDPRAGPLWGPSASPPRVFQNFYPPHGHIWDWHQVVLTQVIGRKVHPVMLISRKLWGQEFVLQTRSTEVDGH